MTTFLDQLQADLKQFMQERQPQFVVEALQRRVKDMTLGDLRKLLASPLGQNLDSVRLVDLLSAASSAASSTAKSNAPSRRTKARAPATKTRAPAKKRSATRKKSNPKSTAESVLALLAASTVSLSSTEIATKLHLHRTTVRQALRNLGGRVAVHGTSRFTRYSVKQNSKTSTPPAAQAKKQTPANSGEFDASVLRAMPATGTTTSTAIQAAVGGTADHVRGALRRLVAAGKVVHTGLRNKSRYELRAAPNSPPNGRP